jgi:hypothetical protein
MKTESFQSFLSNFNLLPKYFHIKYTKFNSFSNNGPFLNCDLMCKFLTNNINDDIINFVINVNFFLSIKIPLSFVEMPQELIINSRAKNNNKDKQLNLLNQFKNNYTPVGYEKKASDFTNHTSIIWNVYHIKTYSELKFFKEFNSTFKCGADFLFEKEFETYLLQNNINIGSPIRCITKFFKEPCLKFKSYELRFTRESFKKIFYIQYTYDINYTADYLNFCTMFWNLTDTDTKENLIVYNKIGCFDIECGLKSVELYENINSEKLPFPTVINGYVQSLVIYTVFLSNEYVEKSPKIYILCLCPASIIENISEKMKFFNDLVISIEKFNICLEDIEIKLFDSELELIDYFFLFTFQIDYLIGFNSKSFDLSFLILRANILTSQNWFAGKFINSYSLSKYGELYAKTNQNINLFIRCSKCEKKIYINSDKNILNSNIVTCLCQTPSIIQNKSIEFEQKSSFYYIQELPFTYHHDLIQKEQLFVNTTNKKLETVTNFNFKQKIAKIRGDKLYLHDEYTLDDLFIIANVFCIGIKLVIFNLFTHSFQIINENVCRLINIILLNSSNNEEIKINIKKFNFKNIAILKRDLDTNIKKFKLVFIIDRKFDARNDLSDARGSLFVSVGKTSDQTRSEQLLWKNTQNIIDTCTYCLIDVLLTISLELKFHTLFDIFSSNFFRICPFNVLSWTSARKSTYISINQRNKFNVEILFNNFVLPKLLNHSLQVEGIPDNNHKDASDQDNIFKLNALKNLDEFLNLNTDTLNCNEFEFGILGNYDPCNIAEIENIITALV